MPRFDEELIAALAEGRLDPGRAAEVEAAVRADPEAFEALLAHRAVLRALAKAQPAALLPDERSRLREYVGNALDLYASEEPVRSTSTPARRRVPWPVLVASAAGLFVVLAITPLMGVLTTGGSGFDFDPSALRTFEREGDTPEADEPADPVAPAAPGLDPDDVDFESDAHAPTGTVVVPPPEDDDTVTTTTTSSPTIDTTSDDEAALLEAIRNSYEADADWFTSDAREVDAETSCHEEARSALGAEGDGAKLFVVTLTLKDGEAILAFYTLDAEGRLQHLIAISPDACSMLASQ